MTTNLKKWGYIQVQMPTHQLSGGIHGGIGQIIWGQAQGTSMGPIPHNSHSTGHSVSPECFTIVDKEVQGVTRNIREAMHICVNDLLHNRNLGKYQFPHIWNKRLQDTSSHHLK